MRLFIREENTRSFFCAGEKMLKTRQGQTVTQTPSVFLSVTLSSSCSNEHTTIKVVYWNVAAWVPKRVCGTQKGNSQSKLTSARNLIVPSEIWEELKLTAIKRDFSSRFSLKKRGKWWQQRSGLAFGKDYTRHALARNAEKLKARILCLAATEPLIWRSFMTTVEFCGCGESI